MPARKRSRLTKRERGLKPTTEELAQRAREAYQHQVQHPTSTLVQREWQAHQEDERIRRAYELSDARLSEHSWSLLELVAERQVVQVENEQPRWPSWQHLQTGKECLLLPLLLTGLVAPDMDPESGAVLMHLTVKGQRLLGQYHSQR